jgi:hypothetical protein
MTETCIFEHKKEQKDDVVVTFRLLYVRCSVQT